MILDDLKTYIEGLNTGACVHLLHIGQRSEYPCVVLSLTSEYRQHHTTAATGTVKADVDVEVISTSTSQAEAIAEIIRTNLDCEDSAFHYATIQNRNIDSVPCVDATGVSATVIRDEYEIYYDEA